MNELEKPEQCSQDGCKNKAYKKDMLTPTTWIWVCKTHYYRNSYGIDYPREKVRCKK